MSVSSKAETIATYESGGELYEIDHLGICQPSMWGWFVVYCRDEQLAEFAITESMLRSEFQPRELPVSTGNLILLAQAAVADASSL